MLKRSFAGIDSMADGVGLSGYGLLITDLLCVDLLVLLYNYCMEDCVCRWVLI